MRAIGAICKDTVLACLVGMLVIAGSAGGCRPQPGVPGAARGGQG